MRRQFLKTLISAPALVAGSVGTSLPALMAQTVIKRVGGPHLKMGLNAYSFNEPLTKGSMNLDQLLEFCAEQGIDGVDLTGYYFPGYPEVPTDQYLYQIKRRAFQLGVEISGTGVRNDFTYPEPAKRKEEIALVKKWIECAAKLGAPVIRVFTGRQDTKGFTWDQVASWMAADLRECAEYGEKHGVMVGIQNHNDFIKTAEHTLKILKMVDSPWCGLILDVGSFRVPDPYGEIALTAPYAINWQIKEQIFVNENSVKLDLGKLVAILRKVQYRGYLPIETLGPGDPKPKVVRFLQEVRQAIL